MPGFAVRGSLYRPGLPDGWLALSPPSLRATRGRFDAHRRWLLAEVEARGAPVILAGHSLGAALAICAAADRPELVERLILFSPAGVPLAKPMPESFLLLVRQALAGLYPPREIAAVVAGALRHPFATHRLARQAHDLDLSAEMAEAARAGVPAVVVGCRSDTLTTPDVCSRIARSLGGEYREVEGGGHMWMLGDWAGFGAILRSMLELEVVEGDIAALDVDAVANAANDHLWMGAGVAGAIKRAGGEEIEREARAKGPIPAGSAVATGAGRLRARHVIHGAVMGQDLRTSADLVERTTRSCLEVADELGCESLALPAFGTGVGGFPLDECARIMVATARGYEPRTLRRVVFAVFGREAVRAFAAEL